MAANGRPRESVWDYPRPPRIEREQRSVVVELRGVPVARSEAALRVCETASPPVVYVPQADVVAGSLRPAAGQTICEFKGTASYFDVVAGRDVARRAAWTYRRPTALYAALGDHIAFYPGRVECYLDGERVEPQPGSFYGGWITAEITGPLKGEPGTEGW